MNRRRQHKIGAAILAGLALLFIGVSFSTLGSRLATPIYAGDDELFHEAARLPLTSLAFWTAHRPWTVPFLHKLAGMDDARVAVLQYLLFLACHIALAWTAWKSLGRRAVGIGGTGLVFAFALTPWVLGWTPVIRSESVAFSLTALMLAALMALLNLLAARRPHWRALSLASLGFLAAATFWIFSRDNWAWQLPPIAGVIALAPWRAGMRRRNRSPIYFSTGLAAILIALFAVELASAEKGDRWRPGQMNVLFQRVFPYPEARQFWRDNYAMPWDDSLARLSGQWCFSENLAGYAHKPFQRWLTETGHPAYFRYLATHPGPIFDGAWRSFHATINPDPAEIAHYLHETAEGSLLTKELRQLLFFPLSPAAADLTWILCVVIPLGAGLLARGRLASMSWTLFIFAAGLPLQAAGAYAADALAETRHMLAVSITLRLLMVLTLALLIAAMARANRFAARAWQRENRPKKRFLS